MYLWGAPQGLAPQLVFYPKQITGVIPKLFRTFQNSYSHSTILHVFVNLQPYNVILIYFNDCTLFKKTKKNSMLY